MMKTHQAGELRPANTGQEVTLAGWVHRRRDHGGIIFFDLRDRSGLVQVVADPRISAEAYQAANTLRGEYVVQVPGRVRRRPEGLENLAMPTGEIEVEAHAVNVLNPARVSPIPIDTDGTELSETMRLKYRYLDLRRQRMQRNITLRHRFIKFVRDYLDECGFLEVETPILFKSTPEGARDFLVPSRLNPGEFYALPQSPQQLKQLLMVAGMEKYFQIARCFRDEDLRADRQLEFTQLDLEMSFVQREDVMELVEGLVTAFVKQYSDMKLLFEPFPRLTYKEAIDRFGRDNPDLRFGMELIDISAIIRSSNFGVFRDAVENGGQVKGIRIPGAAGYSRKQTDELSEFVKKFGAKGLATIAVEEGGSIRSSIAKFLSEDEIARILAKFQVEPGDLLAFVADKPKIVAESLGRLRAEMGRRLGLTDDSVLAICWVIDFPEFEWNEEEQRWDPSQHLFTLPLPEDIPLLDTDPGAARGSQYDLVCNGYEIAGGSIRIHQREIQEKIFPLIGLTREQAYEQFGHMLEAFEYGAPPHGGIAMGVDRFVALLAAEPGIREVIAFPKTTQGADLMAGCPSPVEPKQLAELKLAIAKE